jgi:hypothetical protein
MTHHTAVGSSVHSLFCRCRRDGRQQHDIYTACGAAVDGCHPCGKGSRTPQGCRCRLALHCTAATASWISQRNAPRVHCNARIFDEYCYLCKPCRQIIDNHADIQSLIWMSGFLLWCCFRLLQLCVTPSHVKLRRDLFLHLPRKRKSSGRPWKRQNRIPCETMRTMPRLLPLHLGNKGLVLL